LGATLYHLLTNVPPATVTQRVSNPSLFRPIRELNLAVSPEVERAILRAMEVPIDKRFGSASDMRAALRLARPRKVIVDPGGTMPLAAGGLLRARRLANRRMWGGVGLLAMLGFVLTTVLVVGPTLTPAETPTPTASPTSVGLPALPFNTSVSPTATPTVTRLSATPVVTITRTPSVTKTPSATVTLTTSPTATRTPTRRLIPTNTPTVPTNTPTREPPPPPPDTPTRPPDTNTPVPDTPTPNIPTDTPERPTLGAVETPTE
jgi:hypothetical protein